MATYAVADTANGGVEPTFVAVANGDVFPNDGKTLLLVKNGNASPTVVTVNSVRPCSQGGDHDQTGSVTATTGIRTFGPFDPGRYNDSSGNVTITTYSVLTTVTAAAVRINTFA
jgi:hypothetical protein